MGSPFSRMTDSLFHRLGIDGTVYSENLQYQVRAIVVVGESVVDENGYLIDDMTTCSLKVQELGEYNPGDTIDLKDGRSFILGKELSNNGYVRKLRVD